MASTTSAEASEPKSTPELYYESENPAGQETILFIHGACGSGSEWKDVIPHLLLEDYHILLPDLPAHGKSVSIQPFTLDLSAQLILELTDKHAKNGCAHIVGLSLGAHIVARIAELAKPTQILSLIASGYNTIPKPSYMLSMLAVPTFCAHHLVNFVMSPKKELAQVQNGESAYGLISEVAKIIFDPRVLGEVRGKTLVICAADKNSWLARDKPDNAKEFFEKIVDGKENGSRVVAHYAIRHAWHIEEPKLFADTVSTWVKGEPLDAAFEDIE
ncbi:hypothetical protein N7478_006610 [Penicillium angulare]|uniref:uncharacterized protein n=1 Tax=Penicillium angulare TaxID=116970 RepID=UPI002540365D|nr:uncharacterized protein N7478_006610 [Penicillium angulare]KAJ5281238.1 hypothetical protein N7478_006610 [Penicillium angulare]